MCIVSLNVLVSFGDFKVCVINRSRGIEKIQLSISYPTDPRNLNSRPVLFDDKHFSTSVVLFFTIDFKSQFLKNPIWINNFV